MYQRASRIPPIARGHLLTFPLFCSGIVTSKTLGLLRQARPILVKFAGPDGIESGLRAINEHIHASGTQETPVSRYTRGVQLANAR